MRSNVKVNVPITFPVTAVVQDFMNNDTIYV